MSLYDDLGVGASDTKTEGWSKNFKLLQSQLKVKKAALTQAKTQRMKQTTVLAPVIDLKRGSSSDERQITDAPPHVAAGLKDAVPSAFSASDVLIPLADEYDPMFPNDYEKVVKRHREERQRQREQERQKEIEEREKKRKDRHESGAPSGFSRFPAAEEDSDEEEEYEKERRKRSMGGAAIAPPSSLVDRDGSSFSYEDEGRPARGSKAAIPPPMYEDSDRPRSPPGPTSSFLANMGGTVAHKIMQKYGFKEGQGLGKHEQGLSTALSVEKTSKRGGKIIIGDAAEKPGSSQSGATETSGSAADSSKKSDANPLTEILKNPTKVVLLRNMVGRGEVDEDLEGETKEECEKYGKVVKCVIFEIAEVPDDEAVRIFLEFERVESAIKAVVDLNGRYFGGRVVKACFYNLDKFRVLDLGEQV
ncbi:splicing factor 45 [Maylandia zebra]|uniref:Splicing factor 45 n=3 Tax=Haplochromini TaxID=319058 RepID=A0A3Q2WYG2_HAPBU|nr:splicing factor 45 isoform X1 [Haplochromis burtoni]XP_005942749.1 splicing factor 45 isoform X1 [Haplochromis burtoni]XP_024661397.1 splicing factor 45 [Maylandia zebra]XP_024661398.1 splicing factor 45 [Maylandia zebra]XP_026002495.1 splicing factor 45 [Astatotilapia calliptera]XP_026002496.1 splicing factor 45 [Astatotilapia calliptera]XP_039892478.1 splicing factor 45 isoform X1 [Simochromis diagramma]XP_039892479.1 splicing factor 45 isoform X1 [Simochromis diagramma]XP_042081594.1 